MKLFILRPREEVLDLEDRKCNPWEPWYDKTFGLVIRAETEDIARRIAAAIAVDREGGDAWLESQFSTCKVLTEEGEEGIVIADEHWA